ncbi:hypothetical protein [Lysobacter brunescens]|uniref:Uncharacterized protein n=1 Tax=Lysobacter brunescens TaxID=262323 RepID=A0ABW2YF87_9GAMM
MQPATNVLLVEVRSQFIALCNACSVSPQATLRGMAVRYEEDSCFLPLDAPAPVLLIRPYDGC